MSICASVGITLLVVGSGQAGVSLTSQVDIDTALPLFCGALLPWVRVSWCALFTPHTPTPTFAPQTHKEKGIAKGECYAPTFAQRFVVLTVPAMNLSTKKFGKMEQGFS